MIVLKEKKVLEEVKVEFPAYYKGGEIGHYKVLNSHHVQTVFLGTDYKCFIDESNNHNSVIGAISLIPTDKAEWDSAVAQWNEYINNLK